MCQLLSHFYGKITVVGHFCGWDLDQGRTQDFKNGGAHIQQVYFCTYLGRNHDGVIAIHGIVSHHPLEEKPRESFLWYSLTNSLGMKSRLCRHISLSSSNLLAHLILILFEYNFKWVSRGKCSHGVWATFPQSS